MSAIATEMRECICAIAGERGWTETRQAWLARAARKAGISFRAAKAIFYGEVTDPKASVVEGLRAAAAQKTKSIEKAAQHEFADIAGRLDRLEATLNQIDPDLFREAVAAIGAATRIEERPKATASGGARPLDQTGG